MTNDKNSTDHSSFPFGKLPMRDMSQSLPIALLRGREAIMTGFRNMLHEYDLTDQQWRVLRALAETPELEVVELAERCVILQPSVSRILKKLEDRKLVSRRICQQDRRRSHITITAKGKDLFQLIAPQSEELYKVINGKFGSEKMQHLLHLLNDLTESMAD